MRRIGRIDSMLAEERQSLPRGGATTEGPTFGDVIVAGDAPSVRDSGRRNAERSERAERRRKEI